MGAWPAVLVVDDFRTMTEIMSNLLRQIGVGDIGIAHDGYSALDLLRTGRFGLLLSDLDMKPMDGQELIATVRRDPVLRDLPTILVTAKHDRDVSWLSANDGYIAKPFAAKTLQEMMTKVLLRRCASQSA